MKIAGVNTYLMQAGARPDLTRAMGADADFRGSRCWLFLEIETDEGITGVGECSGWPRAVETAITDLSHVLVGQDPAHIDRLWAQCYRAMMGHGLTGTVGAGALSGIEMALWDIKGKLLGAPVWQLLGGAIRERIPVYGHAHTADEALALKDLGYSALKTPFTGIVDFDRIGMLRDTVGPEIDIAVDAHGPSWMSAADAILVGRELEPYDLLFYEDPVPPENLDMLARVRDHVAVPLAAGERVGTVHGCRDYIERDLVDVIQPDTGRGGGIGQMRKIAAMAEPHGIMLAPHSGSLGPVAEFAALHIMATVPNALLLERIEFDWPGRYEVVTPVLKVEHGCLPLPTAPGLGVELVKDEIAKYPVQRNVTMPPKDDGRAYVAGTAGEAVHVQTRRARARTLRR
ncbi:mandelate racemase/muconate lactonizing enzyme family protein [Psychromarinibacter sp. C21-152]|uniref:Mandelate racemase/muconate lactonizing enzyme family protein n=1 Tax=Psychromarinibacter sediminicola TaxID=3033385 RepID=A0AAE3TAY7_9RHOB|nr:mandelate racemase/muconate lactonizing enzyme family protein [Psychromarinibacter sediminicola]MDF0603742.1 mandelate racemase/muconate lactonizing enzyme family protein [Psychromarinibacter sediminicola]